jgi:hypothetical protein
MKWPKYGFVDLSTAEAFDHYGLKCAVDGRSVKVRNVVQNRLILLHAVQPNPICVPRSTFTNVRFMPSIRRSRSDRELASSSRSRRSHIFKADNQRLSSGPSPSGPSRQ